MPQIRETIIGAILSRLLVMVALVLFGVPQGHADGTLAQSGPAAESHVEKAQGIPSVKRQLMRAQLPDDDSLPDMMAPGPAVQAVQSLLWSTTPPSPQLVLLPFASRVLPPVRGPPVA